MNTRPWDYSSWDSLEGVPELPRTRSPLTYRALAWLGERAPGFALAAALGFIGDKAADWAGRSLLGYQVSPLSGVPIAIILGIAINNLVGIPKDFVEGLRLCVRQVQRLAIALLGFRLSLGAAGAIGGHALPLIVVCIASALVLVPWAGVRIGLSRRLSTLIAVGTSICGVSAIMAVAPTLEAEDEEVSYAVTCVVIFGMLAMLAYPYLASGLFAGDPWSVGVFLGTAIHDTAQVTGAALVYQQVHHAPDVLSTATVVKIIRNLSMTLVVPIIAASRHARSASRSAGPKSFFSYLPLFIIGFIAATALRTLGDLSPSAFGFLDRTAWSQFLKLMDSGSAWLLTVTMAAIGLGTKLSQLRKLGLRPFALGLSAALVLGAISLALLHLEKALRL